MALDVDVREAYRYLGLRGRAPDAATERAVDDALRALQDEIDPKHVARRFALARPEDGVLEIEGLRIESRALCRHLDGCGEVFLMAATLGIGPDRLIARAQAAGAMARAMALQAAAAAMIEALCDAVNADLAAEALQRGQYLRPRFSPGYGDFPLTCQPGLFRLLDVQRRIGVTLTDSCMMIPTKSVTAVVGLCDRAATHSDRCAACERRDCAFRDGRKDEP